MMMVNYDNLSRISKFIYTEADSEHVLHELCHFITLNLNFKEAYKMLMGSSRDLSHDDKKFYLIKDCEDIFISIRGQDDYGYLFDIETIIAKKCASLSIVNANWNEIKTCATEIRAAALLGVNLGLDILGNNVKFMSIETAENHIEKLIWTESSYKNAMKAIGLAGSLLSLIDSEQ